MGRLMYQCNGVTPTTIPPPLQSKGRCCVHRMCRPHHSFVVSIGDTDLQIKAPQASRVADQVDVDYFESQRWTWVESGSENFHW